jgi:ribosomal-protein-alanine N-acetyltransferase
VRVSNIVAQNLYRQYGFVQVGRRKRYYRDNNEDALIMTTPQVDDPRFSHFYATLKTALPDKLARKALCRGRED